MYQKNMNSEFSKRKAANTQRMLNVSYMCTCIVAYIQLFYLLIEISITKAFLSHAEVNPFMKRKCYREN